MEGLAVRCESATGPDRHIDYAIAFAVLPHLHRTECSSDLLKAMGNPKHDIFHCVFDDGVRRYAFAAEAYTASLDAAMTLVPEGFSWSLYDVIGKRESVRMWRDEVDVLVSGSTAALALTAASLRAASLVLDEGEKG